MNTWNSVLFVSLVMLVISEHRRTRHIIQHEAKKIMTALADITAEVSKVKSVELSAIVLLTSLKARLDAAIASQGEDDGEALEALSSDLAASSTALAAAVAQNTPADPAAAAVAPGEATAQTASPAPADLPDGHPFKPADAPAPDAPPVTDPATPTAQS